MAEKVHAKLPGETKPACGRKGATTTNSVAVDCWRCLGVLLGAGA